MVRLVGQRVAVVEEAPQRLVDFGSQVHGEANALLGDLAAFLLDLLALVALQPGQQITEVELGLRRVLRPVELHPFAQQPACALEAVAVVLVDKKHVYR